MEDFDFFLGGDTEDERSWRLLFLSFLFLTRSLDLSLDLEEEEDRAGESLEVEGLGVAGPKGATSSTSVYEQGDEMVSVVDLYDERDLRFKIDREIPRSEFFHVTLIPSFPNIFLALVHAFLKRDDDSREWRCS